MYANKNKSKDKTRNIARGAESTKLSSTDSRYDAGDYEAVPASIRKIRDQRNKELEEANALPAEEIIARQEAEIAELKRQAEANNMTNKYKSVLDDEEEHPTFTNPDSMADFGDYEAVAASARLDAANHDPNQKVFRAKPQVATRKVAQASELSPGDYEAVAAGARHAVPPDEYKPAEENTEEQSSEEAPSNEPVEYQEPEQPEPEYTEPEPTYTEPEPAYTEPVPVPEPEPEPEYIAPEPEYTKPAPPPAPVSAADYAIPAEPAEPAYGEPTAPPAPVSAADYVIPAEPAYTAPSYTAPEPAYTAPEPAYTAPEPVYTAPEPVYTAPEPTYTPQPSYSSPAENYSSNSYSPSGRKIARVADIAPGDYEAVATTSTDDSEMDFVDGSYDFDKFLANAPSLRMHAEPAPAPEESEWANLGDDQISSQNDEPDITEEQTRALTEAIAQETLKGQPDTQFEDIIDNVIAKVLERKKAEEAAKAPAKPEPAKPAPPKQEEKPAEHKPEEPKQQEPAKAEEKPEEPKAPEPAPQVKKTLTAECIPSDAPIDDIPALIVAELDSVDGEVTDEDIKKVIDTTLISRLASGELTLDSVGPARDNIMSEIKEMQEEEARILAELSGEKHEFKIDFIPKDAAIEDVPGIVLEELEKVKDEVPDDDVKKAIDTYLIAKLTTGDLTLDSFQEARDSLYSELRLIPQAEEKAEPEVEQKEEEETQVEEEAEPETKEEPEPAEEPEPVAEEPEIEEEPEPAEEQPVEEASPAQPDDVATINTDDIEYKIEKPELEPEEAEAAKEEEEEETTEPIPVPKEPTVLEYDPIADAYKFTETDEDNSDDESSEEEPPEEELSEEEPLEPTSSEIITEEPDEVSSEEEQTDEDYEGVPLSAAAVLAMQNQEETEEEAAVEEPVDTEVEEPTVEENEQEVEEEPIIEDKPEEPENLDMQMTFDDIFRNPFVNDFEPLKEEPVSPDDTEVEAEEPVSEETAAEDFSDSIEEDVELDDIFIKEEPEPEPAEEPKKDNTETLQKYGVDFVDEEEAAEEQNNEDYNEAKEKRHEDMQNALLMAMVDDGGKTFGETVSFIMEKENLTQKTMLSRMPINKDELKKVVDDPDYRPDKKTAIAICFALRLTWEDSIRLLYKAGHVLSDAQRYDLTIEYLMRRGVYDQNMINSVLLGSGLEGFGIPQSEV